MYHGAARIALLAYVFGGLLLPMTHHHAAPAGALAAAGGGHHGHHHQHAAHHCAAECEAESLAACEPEQSQADGRAVVSSASTDAAGSHHCHGFCALCLVAGQAVALARQVAVDSWQAPQSLGRPSGWMAPYVAPLPRANLLRGPPALLS